MLHVLICGPQVVENVGGNKTLQEDGNLRVCVCDPGAWHIQGRNWDICGARMNTNFEARSYRVLVIDDDHDIHATMCQILKQEYGCDTKSLCSGNPSAEECAQPMTRTRLEVDSAFQGEEALKMVEEALKSGRPYALAFLDVRMPPGWDGVETMSQLWKVAPDLQIVLCTAFSDYSFEELTSRFGFTDNLVILKKPFDSIELLQLAHAMTQKWWLAQEANSRMQKLDLMVRQRTEELQTACERLQQEIVERARTEERFARAFHACPAPMMILTLEDERFLEVNDSFLKVSGRNRNEVIGHSESELHLWADPNEHGQMMAALAENNPVTNQEIRFRDKNGRVHYSLTSAERIEFNQQTCVMAIVHDITERMTLEEKAIQSKKLEAVTQLATGAAHDFNNIMTIILGHANLLSNSSPLNESDEESLKAITKAAERAANLTRQLLAFCRKQVMNKRVLKLNDVIRNLRTLPHLLGNGILLRCQFEEGSPFVLADLHMIEEIITNLALNARDAMPDGGQFQVETCLVTFPRPGQPLPTEATPGEFACLKISDTGGGMTPEVTQRIFEPFFTTKEVGKGSGLGLSTVYGNVAQLKGWIEVDSVVGKGTQFRIYLPATSAAPETLAIPSISNLAHKGTILVVEDELALLELIQQILEFHRYKVFSATNGPEALRVWREHKDEIELLFTDIVMPGGMTGHDLAKRLLKEAPHLQILYTSGFNRDMVDQGFRLEEGSNFLPKPYNIMTMLNLVHELLGDAAESAPIRKQG